MLEWIVSGFVMLVIYGILILLEKLCTPNKPASSMLHNAFDMDAQWLEERKRVKEKESLPSVVQVTRTNANTQSSGGWVYEWVDDSANSRSRNSDVATKHAVDRDKGHTREVWARMGYQVKAGQSPAYTYYGHRVYLPNQVVRIQQLASSQSYQKGKGGHSARVWAKKGYAVMSGESPAYTYYGNEIFLRDQVRWRGF